MGTRRRAAAATQASPDASQIARLAARFYAAAQDARGTSSETHYQGAYLGFRRCLRVVACLVHDGHVVELNPIDRERMPREFAAKRTFGGVAPSAPDSSMCSPLGGTDAASRIDLRRQDSRHWRSGRTSATTTSCCDYFDVYKTTASKGLTYSITPPYFDIESIG
jgi:hypothetical protein